MNRNILEKLSAASACCVLAVLIGLYFNINFWLVLSGIVIGIIFGWWIGGSVL